MAKRKLPDLDSSPGERASVYGQQQMTKRRRQLFLTKTDGTSGRTPREEITMPSELLEFILVHEEAFRSRNRLASLYSDFRSQINTNPEGYQANINAWKKALADAARAGVIPAQGGLHHLLNISAGDELVKALQDEKYGRPTCLPAVFGDAVSKKDLIPLHDFLNAPTSIYHKSWIPSPWVVVRWGLRQIGVLGQPGLGDKLARGDYVVLSNVETAANAILEEMKESTSVDLIISKSSFLKRFATVLNSARSITTRDLDTLLVHLSRDRQAISYDKRTIKFKAQPYQQPVPVTSEDAAIADIKDKLAMIHTQIAPLEERIALHSAEAKEAVRTNSTIKARTALRLKKMAEAALTQRTSTMLQLETVYSQLQQAVDNVEIVKAIEAGSSALRALNERVGGTEGVQGVMDDLQAEMDTAEEINQIINESGEQVDEDEIDDEFAELQNQEKEKREQEEAAKTAARLAELAQAEAERKEKDAEVERKKQEEQERANAEREENTRTALEKVEEASLGMSRLSFQESPSVMQPEGEEQSEPQALPA